MDQRTAIVRSLGVLLAAAWAGIAAWLVMRQLDAPGAAPWPALWPLLPAAIASVAVPARAARRPRAAAVAGTVALALAASMAVTLAEPSDVADRALAAGSAATAYAGALAVAATTLFVVMAHGQSTGAARPVTISLLVGLLGGASLLLPPPEAVAAGCAPPSAAASARVTVTATALVDDREIGWATLHGERSGADESWLAEAAGEVLPPRAVRVAIIGGEARLMDPPTEGAESRAVPGGSGATDARLVAVLGRLSGPEVEDRGIDLLDGETLRHCRRLVSGTHAGEAFELVNALVGEEPLAVTPRLSVWRGELDWWTDETGELVAAHLALGGLGSDAWASPGIRGRIVVDLRTSERNVPRTLDEALP